MCGEIARLLKVRQGWTCQRDFGDDYQGMKDEHVFSDKNMEFLKSKDK